MRFEGYVAKFMGDGVLAYFGWPKAHEHAAERAVCAGLGIVAAVARLAAPTGDILTARVSALGLPTLAIGASLGAFALAGPACSATLGDALVSTYLRNTQFLCVWPL